MPIKFIRKQTDHSSHELNLRTIIWLYMLSQTITRNVWRLCVNQTITRNLERLRVNSCHDWVACLGVNLMGILIGW